MKSRSYLARSLISLRGKKGVSPLIATILLIAFAVALGAVVMNWGSKYVDQQTRDTGTKTQTDIKCVSEPSMEIYEISDAPQLCYNNVTNAIDFVLQNTGTVKIQDLEVSVLGNKSQQFTDTNVSLELGRFRRMNVSYDKTVFGAIDTIEFQPSIKIGSKDVLCVKNSLAKTDVPVCT